MATKETEAGDDATKSDSPGLGMRMTISGIMKKFPTVKNIQTGQLSDWMKPQTENSKTETQSNLKGKLIILDARPEEEYKIGHLPGSVRVDYKSNAEEIIARVPQLTDTGTENTVVCYCSVGYRSSMVAQTLDAYFKEQGSTPRPEVYNLEGSLFKWANEGRPMLDMNNQPTRYAHPYNAMFGLLLNKELRKSTL